MSDKEDPCVGCVHDGKMDCLDRPCDNCPHLNLQYNKEINTDKEV